MAGEFTQFPIPYEQDETNRVDIVEDLNLLSVIIVGVGRRAVTGSNFRKDLIKNRTLGVVNDNHRVIVYDEVRDVTEKIPVADLGETNLGYDQVNMVVTNDAGSNAQLVVAGGAINGLMIGADKTKLDGIDPGANNYSHPDHTGEVTSTGDGAQVITPNAVTYAKIQQVTGDRLLGRSDAAGNVEEIVVGDNLTLSAGRLDAAASTYVHPNHTGDATSIGDGATTVIALRGVPLNTTIASPSDGKILVYRSGQGFVYEDKPASGATPALTDLTDVTITAASDNEVLAYNQGTNEWINQSAADAQLASTTIGLNQFPASSTTSAEFASILTDQQGSGQVVFDTNPTITNALLSSPILNSATIGLGDDMDVGNNDIVSSGTNNITLRPAPGQDIVLGLTRWPQDAGVDGQVLTTNGAGQSRWDTPPGGGDVLGPGASTNNGLVVFDGTTGKAIKDVSSWTVGGTELDAGGPLQMFGFPIYGLSAAQNQTFSASGCVWEVSAGEGYVFEIDGLAKVLVSQTAIQFGGQVICQTNDSIRIPTGTDLERPATPVEGDLRVNTDSATTEIYRGASWRDLEAGTGGGTAADILDCREFGLIGDGSDETATLQAFFDELATNIYSSARLYGTYGISAPVNITGDPINGTATPHIDWSYTTLVALSAISDAMLTIDQCDQLLNTGKLECRGTGGSTYSTRTVDTGLKITDSTRLIFEDLRFLNLRHYGLLIESGVGGNSNFVHIRTVTGSAVGAGLGSAGVSTTWSNPVRSGGGGSTGQETTIDVTVAADDPETKLAVIEDNGDLHFVRATTATTATLFPWTAIGLTSGTIRYVTGALVRVVGGDSNMCNFDQIDATNCAMALHVACLYGPYAKRVSAQACLCGLVLTDNQTAAADSINVQGLYPEGNTYDLVKISTTDLNSVVSVPTAVDWDKVIALSPRLADESYSPSFEKLFGVIIIGPAGDVLAQSNDFRGAFTNTSQGLYVNPVQSSFRTISANSNTISLYKNDGYERLFGYQHLSVLCVGGGDEGEPEGTYTWQSGDGETVMGGATYDMTFTRPAWVTAWRRGTNWDLFKTELGYPDSIQYYNGAVRGSYGGSQSANNFALGDNAGGASPTGNFTCCVGTGAGQSVTSSSRSTFFGVNAGANSSSGWRNTAFGYNTGPATGSATSNVLVGSECVAEAGVSGSIGIGDRISTTAAGQFVGGSSVTEITDVYFGGGVTSATPPATTFHGTGGVGSNIVGGDVILAPGQSTGAATPASVKIQGTAAEGTGSTPQSPVDVLEVKGSGMRLDRSATFTAQAATGTGTTTNIDWTKGNKFNFTFGAGNETLTFDDPIESGNFVLLIKQDATGGRTITSWPANVKWAGGTPPTLSTGANEIDIVSFYFDGTDYYGMVGLNFS